ncbi:MAG: ABC transporter ATP-binding protein [Eubacterium sp.]|nr:ABC transporter ATP-binding protein [Eubacterium sp.]
MNIISTENLTKIYPAGSGELVVLNNLSIHIPEKSLVMLQGRSGSGKTTLINILSSLETPTSGDIIFDDMRYSEINDEKKEYLRRTRMGFVFQSVALIPIMTAYENIDFGLRVSEGLPKSKKKKKSDNDEEIDYLKEKDNRIREALRSVGLEERMNHIPSEMSGGEQQRVAIARAFVHKPSVIFADEPTGALDTAAGINVVKLFRNLVDEYGLTIVMSTHDRGLLDMADVVYSLENGNLKNDE